MPQACRLPHDGAGLGFSRIDEGLIKNSIFANNIMKDADADTSFGAGLTLWGHANIKSINNTFVGNKAYKASAIGVRDSSNLELVNTIIWDNPGTTQLGLYIDGTLTAKNSVIGDGKASIDMDDMSKITSYDDQTMIETNPIFCDTINYLIRDTSPCVGTGENGSNMGARGIGCYAPTSFDWVSTALDTINITKDNTGDTYDLQWSASTDADGDTIDYLLYAQIGVYPPKEINDTTSTSVQITYEEFAEKAFEDFPMLSKATVRFTVSATDGIDTVKVTGDDRVVFVNRYEYLAAEGEGIPTEFALHENYPNPFNPTTTLRFDLPEVSSITLTIYNMLGQRVRTFNMNDTPAGYHSVTWNATNDYGDPVGAGVYLYQLRANQYVKTRKMVLLK